MIKNKHVNPDEGYHLRRVGIEYFVKIINSSYYEEKIYNNKKTPFTIKPFEEKKFNKKDSFFYNELIGNNLLSYLLELNIEEKLHPKFIFGKPDYYNYPHYYHDKRLHGYMNKEKERNELFRKQFITIFIELTKYGLLKKDTKTRRINELNYINLKYKTMDIKTMRLPDNMPFYLDNSIEKYIKYLKIFAYLYPKYIKKINNILN